MIPTPRLAGVLLVVALLVSGCGDDDAASTSTTTTTSTTSTSTVAPLPSSTTSTTSTASTVPPAATPDAPTPVAGPGGGSGEIAVRWNAVAGAIGYRVERASTSTGAFEMSAEIDTTTGDVTLGAGATNLWSPATDAFEYIEVLSDGSAARYFRVVAYNDAGVGPASAVVCGSPPGASGC